MSELPFELAADEKVIVYGEMTSRMSALNVDEGVGIITNKRFIYLVAKTNLLKMAVKQAIGGLVASLIKNKAKIKFQIQATEIKQILDKKIMFYHYIQIITHDREYVLYPMAERPSWDAAFASMMANSSNHG